MNSLFVLEVIFNCSRINLLCLTLTIEHRHKLRHVIFRHTITLDLLQKCSSCFLWWKISVYLISRTYYCIKSLIILLVWVLEYNEANILPGDMSTTSGPSPCSRFFLKAEIRLINANTYIQSFCLQFTFYICGEITCLPG